MTTQHNPLEHTSLSAALATVQSLVSQGFTSMKVWRELGLWYTLVNTNVAQSVSEGEGKCIPPGRRDKIMNTLQTQALHSYTDAKSNKYLQALYGLISMEEYDSWVLLNKPEIENTLKILETTPVNWLDSHAE